LWTSNIALLRDRAPPPGPTALQAYYLEQQQVRTERMKLAQAPPAAAEKPMIAAGPAALSMTPPPGLSLRANASATALTSLGPAPPEGSAATSTAAAKPAQQSLAPPAKPEPVKPQPQPPQVEQDLFRAEAAARLQKQLQARVGLVERLVAFW